MGTASQPKEGKVEANNEFNKGKYKNSSNITPEPENENKSAA